MSYGLATGSGTLDFDSYPQQSASDAGNGGDPQGFLNADSRAGATAGGKTSMTIDAAAFNLIGGDRGWSSAIGVGFTVSYAYRADTPANMPKDAVGFQRFNPAQIAQTELALQAWSDVADIHFVRVGSGATGDGAYSNQAAILLANYSSGLSGAAAFGSFPGNTSVTSSSGDVWVNGSLSYNANPTASNYGGQVLVHELGHAIGLNHPSDYNAAESGAPVTYSGDADYYEDSRQYTVMSYFNEGNTGGNFQGAYASSPLLDDIAAAQLEYGANMATRIGDTVYGFNSNADQPWLKAASAGTRLVMAVWDAGGNDTFDFSGYSSGQTIDLRAGFFSSVGGLTGNVAIAQGATIENAKGGFGADVIHGNAGDNTIYGGTGNDTLDGGDGGSNYLRGDDGNDVITGGAGFDDINGNKGADTARGGAGNDWVVGGQDGDVLYGDTGNDVIYGNLGNDTAFGGDGDDWMRGGQDRDVLDGGDGADLIWGDRGDDTLTGGAGADVFHIFAGAGIDRVTDFDGAAGDRVAVDDGGLYTLTQSGADTVITLGDGATAMVLAGVSASSLQPGWIIA